MCQCRGHTPCPACHATPLPQASASLWTATALGAPRGRAAAARARRHEGPEAIRAFPHQNDANQVSALQSHTSLHVCHFFFHSLPPSLACGARFRDKRGQPSSVLSFPTMKFSERPFYQMHFKLCPPLCEHVNNK